MNAPEGVAAYFAVRRNRRAGGDFPLTIIFIKMHAYKDYEDEKDNHDNRCSDLFVRMQRIGQIHISVCFGGTGEGVRMTIIKSNTTTASLQNDMKAICASSCVG